MQSTLNLSTILRNIGKWSQRFGFLQLISEFRIKLSTIPWIEQINQIILIATAAPVTKMTWLIYWRDE